MIPAGTPCLCWPSGGLVVRKTRAFALPRSVAAASKAWPPALPVRAFLAAGLAKCARGARPRSHNSARELPLLGLQVADCGAAKSKGETTGF